MDWIKKNYDRFALFLLGAALLVSSVYMLWVIHGFSDRFAPVLSDPPHGKKLTSLETEALRQAQESLAKPAVWTKHPAQLYVSRKFVARDSNGRKMLIDPFDPQSPPLHAPVPNAWFLEHGLEDQILDADVLQQDPDGDGFTNLDEYLGKTDPQDPASHPSYLTKLRLKLYKKVPFRLKFEATDDDGSFQINTVDVKQPTQFVRIDEVIPGTKFKVVKFEKKTVFNPKINEDKDVSELTVEHIESGIKTPLVIRTETDIPDHYARFSFLWKNSPEFSVKKGQNFILKPEPDVQYKLIDIQ